MGVCRGRGALGRWNGRKVLYRLPKRRTIFSMTAPEGLLKNRTAVIVAVLFCLVESVWSWLSITRLVRLPEHPINIFYLVEIFGFAFCIFITGAIAYRSPFWGDRIVFAPAAGIFVLAMVTATIPLTPLAILTVNVADSLLWTIAALASLIVLARVLKASRGNSP